MQHQTLNLLIQLPMAVAVYKGPDYVIELVNDKALELWGKTREEVEQKPAFAVFPELLSQGFADILRRVAVEGEPFVATEYPVDLIRRGVSERLYVNFSYDPLRNEAGTIEGIIGTGTDVTELVTARKKVDETNQALNFRNALLEAHNEATPYAIVIVGREGELISYTRQFVDLWRMPQAIVDGKNDEAALNYAMTMVADPEAFITRVQYLYNHPTETSYDIIPFKDGRLIERYGRAVLGSDGAYYGWAWQFRDVTDREQAQQAVKTKNEELQALYQELQFVTDTIPQLAWTAEPDGSAVFFNKGWFAYTGLTLDESKGNGWTRSLHPDDLERTITNWKQATQTEGNYQAEYRLRRHDGVYRWFLARGTPMKDNTGTITKWYGTTTDIEDRKSLEETLERRVQERTADIEQQKALIGNILEHSPSGITVTETIRNEAGEPIDGRTILANAISEKYIGIPLDVLLQKRSLEIDPALLDSPLFRQAIHTLETGEPFITQYYLKPTGRWLELSVARMDENRLINVFTDVTPIKEGQLQLEKNLKDLRRANVELEHFTYAASHDMKEPIRKVYLFADRLKVSLGEQLDEDQSRYFDRMEVALKRMSSLIDDLLAYSYANQKSATFRQVDLNEVMEQVLKDLDLAIEEKQATIRVDRLFLVNGHERQLIQAFQNLIGNSLKYSRPDTAPEISVSCRPATAAETVHFVTPEMHRQDYYLIEVSDNGIGFDPKDAERIFNAFQRLQGSGPYRGTGVGLSIVRKVIENHNGSVVAEGELNRGSVFKVFLPAA